MYTGGVLYLILYYEPSCTEIGPKQIGRLKKIGTKIKTISFFLILSNEVLLKILTFN